MISNAMMFNFLAGFLGIVFQNLVKAASLKKIFDASNEKFVWGKFFNGEFISILSSVTFVIILAVCLPEILNYRPDLIKLVRITFLFGGAIGSFAFTYFLGKSKRYITKIIDDKTNIADDKVKAKCVEDEKS